MRKILLILIVAVSLASAGFMVYGRSTDAPRRRRRRDWAGGRGGPGRGARPPMPVEFATVKRAPVAEHVLVVGNLIGAATVEGGAEGQRPARERQRETGRRGPARPDRSRRSRIGRSRSRCDRRRRPTRSREATIRQREADLKLAQTNLERNRNLLERQLLPQQTFDDTEARYQAAARAARSREGAVRAVEGAARRAEDQSRQHGDLRHRSTDSSASGSSIRARFVSPNVPGRCRWSTSRRCAWSPTSSRRT